MKIFNSNDVDFRMLSLQILRVLFYTHVFLKMGALDIIQEHNLKCIGTTATCLESV